MFAAVQARFQNATDIQSELIAAERVSAHITYWADVDDADESNPLVSVWGQWIVKAAAPDNAAGATEPEIDVPGNDLPLRLWIAARPEGSPDMYAYCAENMQHPHNGRLDAYKLGRGRFRVCVSLRSATLKQEHWFRLVNDPQANDLELTLL